MRQYEFLKAVESVAKTMRDNGVNAADVEYLSMYEDYERMAAEGHKMTFIFYWLSEQYGVSERTIIRAVKRMGRQV